MPVTEKNEMPNVSNTNGYSSQIGSAGNSSRAYAIRSQQSSFQATPEMRRIDDNVIRLPRGPDGTAGFMLKR